MDGDLQIEHFKEQNVVAILSKTRSPYIVYSAPLVQLANGKTISLPLGYDPSSFRLYISLPDLSFPVAIAFGVGAKIPDVKSKGFGFSFPNFKLGAAGEVEASDSDEEAETKKSGGFSVGKFKGKKEEPETSAKKPSKV